MISLSKYFEDCLKVLAGRVRREHDWRNLRWSGAWPVRKPWGNSEPERNWQLLRAPAWEAQGICRGRRTFDPVEGKDLVCQVLPHAATTVPHKGNRQPLQEKFCLLWGVGMTLVPLNQVNFSSRGRSKRFLLYKEKGELFISWYQSLPRRAERAYCPCWIFPPQILLLKNGSGLPSCSNSSRGTVLPPTHSQPFLHADVSVIAAEPRQIKPKETHHPVIRV